LQVTDASVAVHLDVLGQVWMALADEGRIRLGCLSDGVMGVEGGDQTLDGAGGSLFHVGMSGSGEDQDAES